MASRIIQRRFDRFRCGATLSALFICASCGGSDSTATGSMDAGRIDGGATARVDGDIAGRCATDADCPPEAGRCHTSTGQCLVPSCLTDGCDPGSYCDPGTLVCRSDAPGESATYQAETIVGHGVDQVLAAEDGVGLSALGEFDVLVAARGGRYVYAVDDRVLRIDQATMRVETISGLGWPGHVDGPAAVAQFEVDFYQSGGVALSPDDRRLYFTGGNAIRVVDVDTGAASTLAPPELSGSTIRSLAVGSSGALYVSTHGPIFHVILPDGTVESRPVDASSAWQAERGAAPGFVVVDEERGWMYGLERNARSGALYRWPVGGGRAELLNSAATGNRDLQYVSDGPVANLQMANPGGLSIDAQGYVYIGAGDGRTFRRYDPDSGIVESLCGSADASVENRYEWCIGDGVRNQVFGTWPHILAFDGAGNGFFAYTVWPRVIRLRREE